MQHVVLQQFSNIVLIDICVQNSYFKIVASVIKKAPVTLCRCLSIVSKSLPLDGADPFDCCHMINMERIIYVEEQIFLLIKNIKGRQKGNCNGLKRKNERKSS